MIGALADFDVVAECQVLRSADVISTGAVSDKEGKSKVFAVMRDGLGGLRNPIKAERCLQIMR